MRVVEHPFSDFLRQPNEVVAELEEHDVVLRRRNAPPLRLSDASRDDERAQAFDAVTRLLRNLLVHSPVGLADAVGDVFPWATLLPKRDRIAFVDELSRTLMAASALDNYAPVAQLLREWRATAEIHADPRLARRLRAAIVADGGLVRVPEA
ncbi:MAG TPA: DUF6247 family protein [Ilumatobacteraceae bacterium]|nr:DUF6247 family protein [Ilumatobacteraceae bacterium]